MTRKKRIEFLLMSLIMAASTFLMASTIYSSIFDTLYLKLVITLMFPSLFLGIIVVSKFYARLSQTARIIGAALWPLTVFATYCIGILGLIPYHIYNLSKILIDHQSDKENETEIQLPAKQARFMNKAEYSEFIPPTITVFVSATLIYLTKFHFHTDGNLLKTLVAFCSEMDDIPLFFSMPLMVFLPGLFCAGILFSIIQYQYYLTQCTMKKKILSSFFILFVFAFGVIRGTFELIPFLLGKKNKQSSADSSDANKGEPKQRDIELLEKLQRINHSIKVEQEKQRQEGEQLKKRTLSSKLLALDARGRLHSSSIDYNTLSMRTTMLEIHSVSSIGYISAYIFVCESNGQLYLQTEPACPEPVGRSSMCEEWHIDRGSPSPISYEEMCDLAEEAYPGISQGFEGINEANWREYTGVYKNYIARMRNTQA